MARNAKRSAFLDIPPEEVFAALERLCAGGSRGLRKGEKAPRWFVEKVNATKRRKAKAAAQEAGERRLRAQRAERWKRINPAVPIVARMLRAMEPGKWYARRDLMTAAGVDRDARGKVNQVLFAKGWVERRRNPGYKGAEWRGGICPHYESEWLYRLTAEGEAERERRGC